MTLSPAMCYACQPRLTALEMPEVRRARPEPTGPQYFTFDPLPEVEISPTHRKASNKTHRIKRRSRRVLYPPVAKRYYPAEEPNYAKRLLFILLAILVVQIYNAEEEFPTTVPSSSTEENTSSCSWEMEESPGEPYLLEEPLPATSLPELLDAANATHWNWGEEETTTTSESTLDITQFLEQSPAAF
ncbi:hypothetical protein JRQ81_003456 [Phrynocephalus forsythii]|uniref:Radiation-inducible immediate-early gene IEX-1 n=1 Tax=Phrynocephalus forsythii TaxID=171643 RepID=A0A9Q1AXG3_9SAUR|nr:hypothetical protein JRQ81_003456 [Phrynocephalus forsythii]